MIVAVVVLSTPLTMVWIFSHDPFNLTLAPVFVCSPIFQLVVPSVLLFKSWPVGIALASIVSLLLVLIMCLLVARINISIRVYVPLRLLHQNCNIELLDRLSSTLLIGLHGIALSASSSFAAASPDLRDFFSLIPFLHRPG